jgi:hypothetical protein
MNKTRIGTARIGTRLLDLPPERFTSAALASKNPTNIEPESPMKIEAGFEL